MMLVRIVIRIVLVAVASALLTRWAGWAVLPFAGLVYGFADRGSRARGSIAAIGAAAGWLAILGVSVAAGNDVRAVAERTGAVLSVSAWAFLLLSLTFAALLCGTAAVLGAALGGLHEIRIPTHSRQDPAEN